MTNRSDLFKSRMFARDRRTWIATFTLALIAWVGTTAWLNRHVPLAERRAARPFDDGRFVVLAYDRVVARPDGKNLDRLRLRDQLRSLASSGWQAITLEDLDRAFAGRGRLPAKPILITFDEGYLDTYEGVDPVLRELRWPAVMTLRTERQEARDVSFLFWDRLRHMVQSGLWELASGDAAVGVHEPAATLVKEPPGALLIAQRVGAPPVTAWAPRGADPLVSLSCVAAADRWASRTKAPWLGFVDDPVGANNPNASPFRIARLRVSPRWSNEELLARIDAAVAEPRVGPARDKTLPRVWITGDGATEADGDAVALAGHHAELWLPSTRWADDWALDVRLRLDQGEFWIVQPAPTVGREWRFGGTEQSVYFEDRRTGQPPELLARMDDAGSPDREHLARIVKRGGGVWATWDGRPLAPNPVVLPDRWRGKIGLLAYGKDGHASVTVESVVLTARPFGVHTVSASPSAAEIAALASDAEAYGALSPVWATIDGGAVHEAPFDVDLFRILARRYAWDIIPGVVLKSDGPASDEATTWIANLPERVRREGWGGVRLDLSAETRPATDTWTLASRRLDAGLRRDGKRLVLVTP